MGSTMKIVHEAAPVEPDHGDQTVRPPRTRALLIASISTFDGSLSTPCIVNNISANGARITLSAAIPLASEFKLSVPQRNLTRNAGLIWRRGDQVGVKFLREPEAPKLLEADKDEKIRALEAENASLKAEIGVLKYTLYRNKDV